MNHLLFFYKSPFVIALFIIEILCFNSTLAQNASKILKTETAWNYPIQNNQPTEQGQKMMTISYSTTGQKTKSIGYTANGQIAYQYFFDYKNSQQETYWLYQEQKVKSQTEIDDLNGNLVQRIRYTTDGNQLDQTTWTWENGLKIKEVYYNSENSKVYTIDYIYNLNLKIIREIYTDHLQQEQLMAAIDLNAQAQAVSYMQYKSSGSLNKTIQYQRDAQGRLISKTTYNSNNELETKEVYQHETAAMKYSVYVGTAEQLVSHIVYQYEYYANDIQK